MWGVLVPFDDEDENDDPLLSNDSVNCHACGVFGIDLKLFVNAVGFEQDTAII